MRYLGVILDERLTSKDHVQYIRGKAISRLKILGKTRGLVSSGTSLQLYKTLITRIFHYAAHAYDGFSRKESYALQKVQNCALGIIFECDHRMHVRDMHLDIRLHYLADRTHMLTLDQMYKCIHGRFSASLRDQISLCRDGQTRATTLTCGLDAIVPRLAQEPSGKSFRYRGPWYWNLIDDNIRDAGTIDTFKQNLYKSDTFTSEKTYCLDRI